MTYRQQALSKEALSYVRNSSYGTTAVEKDSEYLMQQFSSSNMDATAISGPQFFNGEDRVAMSGPHAESEKLESSPYVQDPPAKDEGILPWQMDKWFAFEMPWGLKVGQ